MPGGGRLERLAQADRHREAAAALRAGPGVGPATAMTFRPGRPEPMRFGRAGRAAKMPGPAPMARQGGPSRREGGLLRGGDARPRTASVESAWHRVARDEAAGAVYRRPVGNTGGEEAIAATARRLGAPPWRLSTRGRPCRAAD